jgi:biotin carboxylase
LTGTSVIIVDPYSSGATLAGAFRKLRLEPICVLSYPTPPPVYTRGFRPDDFAVTLSEEIGLDQVVRELSPVKPVAVIAGSESGVILADALGAALAPRSANDPARASARRHKGDMVKALEARGVATIATTCVTRPEEAVEWVRRSQLDGRDLVVKPAKSALTDGVCLVPGGDGVAAAVSSLLGTTNAFGLTNSEVVVQERVLGTEYVVDTFSFDGRVSVTNACRYSKVAVGSAFAVYESIEFLPFDDPEITELIDYVTKALDALGVRFGLAHTEVMMTSAGPRLIETGSRPPGAGLPALTEVATGDSGIRRLARYLAGDHTIPMDYRLDWHVTGVYFIARQPGVAANTAAYEKIRDLPSCRHLQVNVRDGDHVPATTDLLSTLRLGWAVLAHSDARIVRRDHQAIREIERLVQFTYPKGMELI